MIAPKTGTKYSCTCLRGGCNEYIQAVGSGNYAHIRKWAATHSTTCGSTVQIVITKVTVEALQWTRGELTGDYEVGGAN